MLARVLTLRFNTMLDGFDDAPLRDFIKDKEVLSIRDHFFVKNEVPYLAVIINYRPQPLAAALEVKAGGRDKGDESWRALIAEADVPLFNSLRDWRTTRSRREGLPPYVIGTNRQLAAMVVARPISLAKLGEIEGFGKAKLERYGKEILAILAEAAEPATMPAAETTTKIMAEAAPTSEVEES
jgi:superfamily II DNA helicase RecQ